MSGGAPPFDVVVAGGGPAAWATAAACGRAGLRTALVTPAPEPSWPATYAAWLDELPLDDLGDDVVRRRWDAVGVVVGAPRRLDRPYGVLANDALARVLVERAARAGAVVHPGAVVGAVAEHDGTTVAVDDGTLLRAAVAVDATGSPPAIVRTPAPPAWQVAHGLVIPTPSGGVPGAVDGCLLMDWTPVGADGGPPSFLYALDLGDGSTLVEETVLAASSPPTLATLAARLERRLAAAGVPVGDVRATESVRIPMGLVAPARQPIVGTGAAGGLVHPATGYSVGASLRAAPRLAAALAAGIDRGATPASLAQLGWDAVWPADRRRARALERYGVEALSAMGAAELAGFFDAFFALPVEAWGGYLSGTSSAADVARLMTRLFRRVPWSLRRHLVTGDPRWLARSLRP